jgi:FkbM family methyltransferase
MAHNCAYRGARRRAISILRNAVPYVVQSMTIHQAWNRFRNVPAVSKHVRVSFAQYAEDLILSQMRPQSRGFYVDVGAYHPRSGSNTYKLYLKGWTGITIEPNPDVVSSFKKMRPRDTHLTIGVSDATSELIYHKSAAANLNSFDPQWHQGVGVPVLERLRIKCETLTNVLDRHRANQPIDLLSVDCEGYDMQVIESLDWSRYRPTVVIVEDLVEFCNGTKTTGPSPIRSFMLDREYALASQAMFSYFYVDRLAFGRSRSGEGFRLDDSQLCGLGLPLPG